MRICGGGDRRESHPEIHMCLRQTVVCNKLSLLSVHLLNWGVIKSSQHNFWRQALVGVSTTPGIFVVTYRNNDIFSVSGIRSYNLYVGVHSQNLCL